MAKSHLSAALLVLLAACGGDDSTNAPVDGGTDSPSDESVDADTSLACNPLAPHDPPDDDADLPPALAFTTSPVTGLPAGVRFASGVAYGANTRQRFDVFLPESATPTAAVFFFHGGGFVQGSRTNAYSGGATALKAVVAAGIAFITVDYQLLGNAGVEDEGVLKSLRDSQRSIQYVRRWATELNIDPERIAVFGSSAGAGTSLWLAYHPDMAIPTSADPVARQSTRVKAAAALSTQATYDVLRWTTDVFGEEYPFLTAELLLSVAQGREMAARFYGLPADVIDSGDEILAYVNTQPMLDYRCDVDMLRLMSADDPDVYVQNTAPNDSPLTGDPLHHPLHARALVQRADTVGNTVAADIPGLSIETPESAMPFLIERLAP